MIPRKPMMFVLCLALIAGMFATVGAAGQGPKIAVLPFDDGSIANQWWGDNWNVGEGIADMIVTELFKLNKYRLIEREQIEQVMQEQDFGAGGRVDQRTAAQIGKILGVQYILLGKVTEFNVDNKRVSLLGLTATTATARVAIDGRLVDTNTGEIMASFTGNGQKEKKGLTINVSSLPYMSFGGRDFEESILGQATRDAVAQLCNQLSNAQLVAGPLTGKVAKVSGNTVYVDLGKLDGIEKGMVFIITRQGEAILDPNDPSQVLGYEESQPICEITINSVMADHLSSGTITANLGGTPSVGDVVTKK